MMVCANGGIKAKENGRVFINSFLTRRALEFATRTNIRQHRFGVCASSREMAKHGHLI